MKFPKEAHSSNFKINFPILLPSVCTWVEHISTQNKMYLCKMQKNPLNELVMISQCSQKKSYNIWSSCIWKRKLWLKKVNATNKLNGLFRYHFNHFCLFVLAVANQKGYPTGICLHGMHFYLVFYGVGKVSNNINHNRVQNPSWWLPVANINISKNQHLSALFSDYIFPWFFQRNYLACLYVGCFW